MSASWWLGNLLAFSVQVALVVALAGQGRYADVVAQARKALEFDPSHLATRYHLANGLALTGQLGEAMSTARLGLQPKPDEPALHRLLRAIRLASLPWPASMIGRWLLRRGKFEERETGEH